MGTSEGYSSLCGGFSLSMTWSKCFGVVVLAATLTGCELWLNVDAPQCDKDSTCIGILGRGYTCGAAGVCVQPPAEVDSGEPKKEHPPRWACIDTPAKGFVPDPDRMLSVRMDAVDFASLKVPPGVKATGCNPADVSCNEPIFKDVEPGSDGFFEFNLPYGFEGFFEFTAPNIVPSLLFRNRAYIDSVTTSGPALASQGLLMDIGKSSGRPIDPTTGVAILEIRDCFDAAGDGVEFDAIGDEGPFYFRGALPTRDGGGTTISNNLAAGREPRAVGGFSNLPVGPATFPIRLADTKDTVATVTLLIRAGYITYVRVYPGSSP
jgi:hypothetical protein